MKIMTFNTKTIFISALFCFSGSSFANSETQIFQVNTQATININQNCVFTGSNRNENDISFFVNCTVVENNKSIQLRKRLLFNDNGEITSFDIKYIINPKKDIELKFNRHYGFDWDKLNDYFSKLNKEL